MSDYIPFEVQEKIMERLPVKSLIQFRSVSKAWKSLIDSPEFIAAHSVLHTQPPRLLVKYIDQAEREINFVTFVDDETFPQQRFVPTLPDQLSIPTLVGCSRGLFCFSGYYQVPDRQISWNEINDVVWNPFIRKSIAIPVPVSDRVPVPDHNFSRNGKSVVVWNPSIRKSIAIPVPDAEEDKPTFGFGVSPVTCDPKIVAISPFHKPWKADVYTLSSRKCTSLSTNHLPCSFHFNFTIDHVTTERFIYWLACDYRNFDDGGLRAYYLIVSFDLITEQLGEVILPDILACQLCGDDVYTMLTINKVHDCLALLENKNDDINNEQPICVVWKMDDDVQNTFTKLFTVKGQNADIPRVWGFRNNGEPIVESKHDVTDAVTLIVYKPYSEHITDIGIIGRMYSFCVDSYMETLLLLDH